MRKRDFYVLTMGGSLGFIGFLCSWAIAFLQFKENGDWVYFVICAVIWALAIIVLWVPLKRILEAKEQL